MGTQQRVRGRPFESGNPGRPPGSQNKSTLMAARLTDEEAEAVKQKGLELAQGGNAILIKFFLERQLPRERIVPIRLPRISSAVDSVDAMEVIAAAVAEGLITPGEAADLTRVVDTYVRAIETAELQREVEILRRQLDPKAADLDKVYAEKPDEPRSSK